jgi:hypothetical protein
MCLDMTICGHTFDQVNRNLIFTGNKSHLIFFQSHHPYEISAKNYLLGYFVEATESMPSVRLD